MAGSSRSPGVRSNTETVDDLGRGKNTPHHCSAVACHSILSIIPRMLAQPSHSSQIWGSNEVALTLNSCYTWPTLTDADSGGGSGSSGRMAWIFQIKRKDILSRILCCHLGNQDQCLEVCCGGPAAASYPRGTTAPCAKEHLIWAPHLLPKTQ